MTRRRMLTGVLLLLAILAVTGCYTVLRHPTGTDVVQGVSHGGSYYRSCADCHADAQYYHPYYSYGRSHYRWNDYYGSPWWYDDYWWWDHHDDDGGVPAGVETGERHLWGSGGWASSGWGFTKRPATPTPRPDPPASDGAVDDSKQPEPKDEKAPKEPENRNLWKGKKKKGF